MKMKRQDRETPPRNKRQRAGYGMHERDAPRERMSPDFDRRDSRGSGRMGPGGRDGPPPYLPDRDFDFPPGPRKSFRDDRMMGDFGGGTGHMSRMDQRTFEYRSLCITNISSKIPGPALKESLTREFKKFGEFNVKITFNGDHRIAYVNFRYPQDAKAARHAKAKLTLFERPVRVEPVHNKRRSVSPPGPEFGRADGPPPPFPSGRGGSPSHSMGSGRRTGRHPSIDGRDFPPRDRDFQPFENRRAPNEKFPHHLQHVNPEDDDKATRTLFVGNLDYNISENDLRHIFERYGMVEDIDIKRPAKGQGNAYAFIKFFNLDFAHKAKVDMSGKHIGRFQCKIGYGKANPTTCLWVGGLGPWITHETLEREFDRFGVIHRIEWPHGKNYAYVLYDSIDAAQAACQDMRGFPLGGADRRLRVDFADITHITQQSPVRRDDGNFNRPDQNFGGRNFQGGMGWGGGPGFPDGFGDDRQRSRGDWSQSDRDPMNAFRNPDNPRGFEGMPRRGRYDDGDQPGDMGDRRQKRPRTPDEQFDRHFRRSPEKRSEFSGRLPDFNDRDLSPDSKRGSRFIHDRDGNSSFDKTMRDGGRDGRAQMGSKELSVVDGVDTVVDFAKCLPVAWNGALILKSNAFPARMHVVSGDVTIVDTLMRDPTTTETPVLRITQRLRLDQPKLEEVGRRVQTVGPTGHCILLALPSTLQNYEDPSGAIQQRPLRNLISYLKQKEAAGVISLPPNPSKDKDNVGILYAFPQCQFGHDFLLKRAPKLPSSPSPRDEHLVVVVVKGAA
ncbi:RNA-binding protein spenito-like [Liolophura sinensis]|uniref:RNA-binding protein spenito-like n=1 Tax=Liolophura sinensis TaxID=3198878 RepID=UPI003158C412